MCYKAYLHFMSPVPCIISREEKTHAFPPAPPPRLLVLQALPSLCNLFELFHHFNPKEIFCQATLNIQ